MAGNIEKIINYSEGRLSKSEALKFEDNLLRDNKLGEDYKLFRQINKYLQGKFDLEQVKYDPVPSELHHMINNAIEEYHQNQNKYTETQKFIKDTLSEHWSGKELREEMKQIEYEINELNVGEISEGWVKDWICNHQGSKIINPADEKMKNYITNSLYSQKKNSVLMKVEDKEISGKKYLIQKVIVLAAAIFITGLLLFKVIIPSDNPEKLYKKFYRPVDAVSPVIRGSNSELSAEYVQAIEQFNKRNYQRASVLFDNLLQKDTFPITSHFFMGITQLELGNYAEAVNHLSIVASAPNEYLKDARWYLGLTYLKTGDKTKAIPFFEILSQSEGYYQNQAGKLLRRLK